MAAFLETTTYLSTVLGGQPPKLGYFVRTATRAHSRRGDAVSLRAPLHNATGTPAMSVPLHWTADGRPVGVHIRRALWRGGLLLQLAVQLERRQPWFDRLPSL